jgi:Flp pilus assembly protein TadD
MKKFGFLALVLAPIASVAVAAPAPRAEVGYPVGSLALSAIERGDWATAERLLTQDSRIANDDPARLINLGRVYIATGRTGEALAVWRQAAEAAPAEVETAGGRVVTTDQLAREAIAFYTTETAAR